MGVQPAEMKEGYLSWRWVSKYELQHQNLKKNKNFLT